MVIWLLGLSGSGKTTLGRKLQSYLEEISIPHYMIDGEIISPDHFDYNIIDTPNPAKLSNAKSALHYVLAL